MTEDRRHWRPMALTSVGGCIVYYLSHNASSPPSVHVVHYCLSFARRDPSLPAFVSLKPAKLPSERRDLSSPVSSIRTSKFFATSQLFDMADDLPRWAMQPIRRLNWKWNRVCPHCGTKLLTTETAGFCCGTNGEKGRLVPALPPLPHEYNSFLNSPDISSASRVLNLLFSFAALESSDPFPTVAGGPSFFAIQGRVFHRIRPSHENSGTRWLLYDGYMRNHAPFGDWINSIPEQWTTSVSNALLRLHPFAQQLRVLHLLPQAMFPNAQIILHDPGTAEIAALIIRDNTAAAEVQPRSLVVTRQDGLEIGIKTINRLWEPLVYPLFFPSGTMGWGVIGAVGDIADPQPQDVDNLDGVSSLMWHVRVRCLREERFEIFGRLTCEYLVDMWTRELDSRLHYITSNQKHLRQQDAELMGQEYVEDAENIFLPASFIGGRFWCSVHVANALAVAAVIGVPTFFITFTCNPLWKEIQDRLLPGQSFADVPLVVARVFKRKLAHLLQLLNTFFPTAGRPLYVMYTIEFQKRGLPHAHILIKYDLNCTTPEDIDAIISAEMPTATADRELVSSYMMHTHPAANRPAAKYCQTEAADGTRACRFHYPHPLQQETTIDTDGRVHYRRRNDGDQTVVPHCLTLLRIFECHINVECANTSAIFQYLFKYIHKGPDRTLYRVGAEGEAPRINEAEEYESARYISAGEAAWRILGFHITRSNPAVTMLPIHLPGTYHHHQYGRIDNSQSIMSLLDRYFLRPLGDFTKDGISVPFASLTYLEYYRYFRHEKWHEPSLTRQGYFAEQPGPAGQVRMLVIQRQASNIHVTRLQPARVSQGERFYLRVILGMKPALSFEDARTVGGHMFLTYQEACTAMGAFANASEAEYSMREAVEAALYTPRQLRYLFVHLLVTECCNAPLQLWDTFKANMALDFLLQNNNIHEIAIDYTLLDLAEQLEQYTHKTLADFGLPNPERRRAPDITQELRRWGNADQLRRDADAAYEVFNPEQKAIFDLVIAAVIEKRPLCIFIDGKAGRGKTFLIKALCSMIRSMGKIVIPAATSALAAQLYPGGRTAHAAFKIPVVERNEMLESFILPGTSRAALLEATDAFAWDEAPAANKAALHCSDALMRLLMEKPETVFGGKIFMLAGDYRQCCPVIPYGTRAQVVAASIRSSHLWDLFTVHHLITPIRNAADPEYAAFVDAIGDGAGPDVELNLLAQTNTPNDLIDFVFPAAVLSNPIACLTRCILAPTNAQIREYNASVKARLDGVERTYLASDSLKEAVDAEMEPEPSTMDFVAQQTPSGLPDARIVLRVGSIVRLLRNFSLERGLVNNTRAVVRSLGSHIITIRKLNGLQGGVMEVDREDIIIPRITFTHILHSGHTLLRKQFPLALAYATTFNSCQGLTLDRVGIDCTRPVFSHGQLYTALSRISRREHALVCLPEGESSTKNVTYPEILL